MVVQIPLSKRGKFKHTFFATVDDCDAELAKLNWTVFQTKSGVCYAKRFIDGKTVMMHRVILARKLEVDELLPTKLVDHIDGDGLNNTRDNLRPATRTENNQNCKIKKTNKTGYKGVYWSSQKQKYQACIMANGKKYHLGFYENPIDAHKAYCDAAMHYHGKFANFGSE